MNVITLSKLVPVGTSHEKAEHLYYSRIHAALPDGWISEEVCEDRIARVLGYADYELPAAASLMASRMVGEGWLEKLAGRWPEYRRATEPPEFLTPAQATELREERAAREDRENRDHRATEEARRHEEEVKPILEAEDREFMERAERLLGITALKAEVDCLRSELHEMARR